jgi:hypothetical protein
VQVADDQLAHIFRTILDWHLVKAGFPGDIQSLAPSLIAATLEVYSAATKQLLPTPAKSHYLFNLRDFARIVQVSGWDAAWVPALAAGSTGGLYRPPDGPFCTSQRKPYCTPQPKGCP